MFQWDGILAYRQEASMASSSNSEEPCITDTLPTCCTKLLFVWIVLDLQERLLLNTSHNLISKFKPEYFVILSTIMLKSNKRCAPDSVYSTPQTQQRSVSTNSKPLSVKIRIASAGLGSTLCESSRCDCSSKSRNPSVSADPRDRQPVSIWLWCHIWKSYSSPSFEPSLWCPTLPNQLQTNVLVLTW